MRFLLAVEAGGGLIGLTYWNELDALPWPIRLGFMAVVAFAVGFAVGPRGWLAALAASSSGMRCGLASSYDHRRLGPHQTFGAGRSGGSFYGRFCRLRLAHP
jgi:hypothetical protein